MLAHGFDADGVARGVFDIEMLARFCSDLIGGSLGPRDGDARLQSADHEHRNRILLLSVVAEAIGHPDIWCGFQTRRGWKVYLKVRLEDSDDSRTEGLSII